MIVRPYIKKNNELMIYVNDYDRKISLPYGADIYTTKLTKGQKSLLSKFYETLDNTEPLIRNFEKKQEHDELHAVLYKGLEVYLTDVSKVCGNKVDGDGLYLLYNGNLYNASQIK